MHTRVGACGWVCACVCVRAGTHIHVAKRCPQLPHSPGNLTNHPDGSARTITSSNMSEKCGLYAWYVGTCMSAHVGNHTHTGIPHSRTHAPLHTRAPAHTRPRTHTRPCTRAPAHTRAHAARARPPRPSTQCTPGRPWGRSPLLLCAASSGAGGSRPRRRPPCRTRGAWWVGNPWLLVGGDGVWGWRLGNGSAGAGQHGQHACTFQQTFNTSPANF